MAGAGARGVGLCLCCGLLAASGVAEEGDPCKCLSWKEVYDSKRASCGEFSELMKLFRPRTDISPEEIASVTSLPGGADYVSHKCKYWLHLDNSNLCVNVDTPHWSGMGDHGDLHNQAFCYVSSKCSELNGGFPLANRTDPDGKSLERDISVKLCRKGEDRMIRDMSPSELAEHTKVLRAAAADGQSPQSLGNMAMEAYKHFNSTIPWAVIQGAWDGRGFEWFPPKLQAAMLRKEPFVIPASPDGTHLKIIHGWRLMHLVVEVDETMKLRCPDSVHCLREDPVEF